VLNSQTEIPDRVNRICEGLIPYFKLLISRTGEKNSSTIVDFLLAIKIENNISECTKSNYIVTVSFLSLFHKNKAFKQMSRDDILSFLDSFRKSEVSDPLHRWIGTYNNRRVHSVRFFRWLHYPNLEQKKRPKPPCIENIPQLARREKSIYKPTDLWTLGDDLLFLRYCPSKRDCCYHAISRDTSCRPHEILKLRIKDVVFKTTVDNKQYAEVLVNGKTGSRHIPLINSIPYLKDWLDDHPQRGNPNASLICGIGKSLGRRINTNTLFKIYSRNQKLFEKLIDNPNVPPEDKNLMRDLLKKPWNPYIRRHSALTEKSKILKEHVLRQHAGWSNNSDMPQKYLHYFGNESSESLLEAYGVVTKEVQFQDQLKSKQCPNCSEPNKPDSRWCVKCRMVLSYNAYTETVETAEEKQQNRDALSALSDQLEKLTLEVQQLKNWQHA
jgi:integrase/recombinase XerD